MLTAIVQHSEELVAFITALLLGYAHHLAITTMIVTGQYIKTFLIAFYAFGADCAKFTLIPKEPL